VIDKKTTRDPRPGMYLYPGEKTYEMREKTGKKRNACFPHGMIDTMKKDSVKSRITRQDLYGAAHRRVLFKNGPVISFDILQKSHLVIIIQKVFYVSRILEGEIS